MDRSQTVTISIKGRFGIISSAMNKASSLLLSSFLIFLAVPQGSAAPAPEVATYEGLLRAIREIRAASEARIETAVEQEKVREAWETGKLIDEHILLNKERADYGKRVIQRLGKDLAIGRTELYYMLEFARTYPIVPAQGQLSLAHYKELLSVNDETAREEFEKKAMKENWSQRRIRREINKRNASPSPSPEQTKDPLPVITPGPLNTYQVIKLKDFLKIDLGFGIYHDLPEKDAGKFKEGDIVQWNVGARSPRPLTQGGETPPLQKLPNATNADLYTYPALVTQVTDGDSVPRKTAQEMRVGPSKPICGNGLQSALSGFG